MTLDDTALSAEESARRAVSAVWRIDAAKIVATLTRYTGDFALAEDLAQEALAEALAQWPRTGVPRNGGAWLTTTAKRRAIDHWRRRERYEDRLAQIAGDMDPAGEEPWDPDEIDDDVLRLIFISCHPVLAPQARVALTLRIVAGLSTEEIAAAFLVPVSTVQQRIVRAKKQLAEAEVPFEAPAGADLAPRLAAVLGVIYLVFTEAHAASHGDDVIRPELAREALRLGRSLAVLLPNEPSPHGLVALMELTASRFPARLDASGDPVLLADQDRARWDRGAISRGRAALARVDRIGRGRDAYALQAGIAECHALAPSVEETDWATIVRLYDALLSITPSPIIELNRASAVAMASGPAEALEIVERLAQDPRLRASHLVPSVRAELLERLGRAEEAREAFAEAAARARNARDRAILQARAATGR
ncbi:RNA polymerase sigma factor [Microbacterium karelineae]|uniref:RNA polymerase sigma factor n=1 Tax=Microbacterium karelineae TaxID=2654283 RepID=UPI0012EAFC57|nr:sigma-70 family RNA polymerase sigma factor [Microbacterium karelineae]